MRRLLALVLVWVIEAVSLSWPFAAYAYPAPTTITGLATTSGGSSLSQLLSRPVTTGVTSTVSELSALLARNPSSPWLNGARAVGATLGTAGGALQIGALVRATGSAGGAVVRACVAAPLVCAAGTAAALYLINKKVILLPDGSLYHQEEEVGACYSAYNDFTAGLAITTEQVGCHSTPQAAAQAYLGLWNARMAAAPSHSTESYAGVRVDCDRISVYTVDTSGGPSSYAVGANWSYPMTGTYSGTVADSGPPPKCVAPTGTPTFRTAYTFRKADAPTIKQVPITAPQAETYVGSDTVPPDDVLNQLTGAGTAEPIPVGTPTIPDQRVPLGEPYQRSASSGGGWAQDVADVSSNAATPDPLDVEVTPKTVTADDPTTPEDEGGGNTTPGTGEKPVDQCQLYPDSVGCIKLGQDDGMEVPKRTASITWAAEDLGLPAGCPAPIPLPNGSVLSYQFACDAAPVVKAVVLVVCSLAAAFVCIAAIRGS